MADINTCARCGEDFRISDGHQCSTGIPAETISFVKDDKKKVNMNILFDCPHALEEIAKVMSMGAEKYSRKNWALVEDHERYESAVLRHKLLRSAVGDIDSDSGLHHIAHEITSLLFLLELKLKED